MENNIIEHQLQVLQQKLQQLLKQHQLLQKENETLKKQLQKKQLTPQENLASQTSTLLLDEKTKEALAIKIDTYLKEIDQCLLLLNATA